uniref:Crystaline entomocidal protoxin n=1 Tax=Bacillus thuringiensis TaxID=1428 RepID=J7H1B3_BACTU|nr:Cry8-like delta-endotoxin [Bacillus thuringiensis]
MSPNNQNEYEIIDTPSRTSVSNDSVRYPFANEPTTDLNNMNYKDYLRMSEVDDATFLSNPEAFIDSKSVQTIIGIVGKGLGVLGVPGAAAIAQFFSFLVGQLWPSTGEFIWEQIIEQVEALVDQKITDYARNKALSEVQGLGEAFAVYQQSLQTWQENRTDSRVRGVIIQQFIALDLDFVNKMPSFAVSGQEVPLLAVYALAANIHLLLLRDASLFGAEWGFATPEISDYYNRQIQLITKYTDYCVNWYNTGLGYMRKVDSTGSGNRQTRNWLRYHQFRREMTLMVLDVLALFPGYDIRTYPGNVHFQLTREVYTDPIVFNPSSKPSGKFCDPWESRYEYDYLSEMENVLVRPPHLFEIFVNNTYFTGRGTILFNDNEYINYMIGNKITYRYTNDDTRYERNYGSSSTETNSLIFGLSDEFDIFNISSVAANLANYYGNRYGFPYARWYCGSGLGGSGYNTFTYSRTHTTNQICTQSYDAQNELPPEGSQSQADYSHRLAHIASYTIPVKSGGGISGNIPLYAWTHRSASKFNYITPNRINHLPMVKSYILPTGTSVVQGPGFTGGNLLKRATSGQIAKLKVELINFGLSAQYRVRIRYASTSTLNFRVFQTGTLVNDLNFNRTMSRGESLTHNKFKFASFTTPFMFTSKFSELRIDVSNLSSGEEVYVDSIEVIPVNATYEAETNLEVAKKAVMSCLRMQRALQTDVTDYQVNQVANLIECVSDEVYPNEKRLLFDAVKEAKRLDQARNLLQDPNFQEINGENGWTGSTGIEIVEGDLPFKDRSLRLPSAREMERETYPTYIYQKIEESRLKPNTRYKFRGFIGSSQDLEIYVIRHQAYRVIKNVSNNLLPNMRPINACGGVDRCNEQKQVNTVLGLENNVPNGNTMSDSHEFSIPVDTGELNYNENPGIWVVFKITTTDGYATVGNIELVEEETLSGEALERVQQQEKRWQDQMARRRAETENRYGIAKQAIDRLFVDYSKVSSSIEISDLTAAQNLVQSIPYVYNEMLPEIPGMNYTSVTELTNRLQQAWNLYDQRNSIQNGDFRNDVRNWNVTPGVNIQQMNDTSVLVIPNWDSQVSQQITVQPNRRYVLRVTARKEGNGDGYVTIRDGANHTETLTFNTCDYDGSSVYDNQAFNANNDVYTTQSSNTNRYNTNGVYHDQTSYITKTVEFIPYTEQVWIEMSETEGVFYVESVELIVEEM